MLGESMAQFERHGWGMRHAFSSGALRVVTCRHLTPVTLLKHGSANGNRTCIAPVQFGSVRSKSVQIRSVSTPRSARNVPQTAGVPARCQRGRTADPPISTRPQHRPSCLVRAGTLIFTISVSLMILTASTTDHSDKASDSFGATDGGSNLAECLVPKWTISPRTTPAPDSHASIESWPTARRLPRGFSA